jgi:prophage regulatory protein
MTVNATLRPRGRFLRQREVLKLVGVSRPTLWDWRRRGFFPAPRRLGPNTIGWLVEDVKEWMESRPTVEY